MSTVDANWYREQIKRVPMLTAAEEITLGTQVQAWLNEENPSPALVRRGRRAQNRMVEANLRLVVTLANKYLQKVPNDYMDLIQAGNLGLIRAVEKYDPTRGYKFSTYAYWWIRQGVTRWVEQNSRLIRLPASATGKLYQLSVTTRLLLQELQRNPTKAELAEAMQISVNELEQIIARGQLCLSLDAYANGNDSLSTVGDLIADRSGLDVDEQFNNLEDTEAIQQLLAHLSVLNTRQRFLIEGTFGIGQAIKTISSMAKELGVNSVQALKLLNEAKMQLKLASNAVERSTPPPLPTAYIELNQLEIIDTSTVIVATQRKLIPAIPRRRKDPDLIIQPTIF